jgi:hypothetical protein
VVLANAWSSVEESIPADTVILCMMRHSDDALYQELAPDAAAIVRIGDCVAPREIDDALFEAVREGISI